MDIRNVPSVVAALHKQNDAYYAQICTEFFDEIKACEKEVFTSWAAVTNGEVTTYTYSGDDQRKRQWRVEQHRKYAVTTWTFTGDERDRQAGRVGSDGRTIIKFVNPSSYDFIRTEDFITRGMLAFDALLHSSIDSKYFADNAKGDARLLSWIEARKKRFRQEIYRSCALDMTAMTGANNIAYFNPLFSKARDVIANTIVDIAERIKQTSKYDLVDIIKDLEYAEKLHIIQRGRPAYIKIGAMVADDNAPLMVSAQFTQGEQTIPSSVRLRDLKKPPQKNSDEVIIMDLDSESEQLPLMAAQRSESKEVGQLKAHHPLLSGAAKVMLSNHVVDFIGIVRDDRVMSLMEIVGHCSYPPISVKDKLTRRYLAYHAVLENVTKIAFNRLREMDSIRNDGTTPARCIHVPLSSMMLLTPLINGTVDGALRQTESEDHQVAESAIALDMVRYADQPMTLMVDGQERYVHVDISYMNIPVNLGRVGQYILSERELQNKINNNGFYHYCMFIEDALKKMGASLPLSQDNAAFDAVLGQASYFLDLYHVSIDIQREIEDLEDQLKQLNHDCVTSLTAYAESEDSETKEKNKRTYLLKREEINKTEKLLHLKHAAALDNRKSHFVGYAANIVILQSQINSYLEKHRANSAQRDYCLLLQRFLRAQDMYFHKKYSSELYQFQVIYLLSSMQAGRLSEAFCKSAEDRTGWLRISLLAYHAFNLVYGHDPDIYNKEEKAIYTRMLVSARQLSASIENTEQNSDARGPQVDGDTTWVPDNVISKKSATLAKLVITRAKQIARERQSQLSPYQPVARDGAIGAAFGLLSVIIIAIIIVVLAALNHFQTHGVFADALFAGLDALAAFGGSLPITSAFGAALVAGNALVAACLGSVLRNVDAPSLRHEDSIGSPLAVQETVKTTGRIFKRAGITPSLAGDSHSIVINQADLEEATLSNPPSPESHAELSDSSAGYSTDYSDEELPLGRLNKK